MKKDVRIKKAKVFSLMLAVMMFSMLFLTACGTVENGYASYDLKVKEQTQDFYVNDFANLFTDLEKEELMEKAINMDKDYSGIQVVVTTVNSLKETVVEYDKNKSSNFTIEEVAYSMYSQYGIGQDDMGILILFSTGDREVRIETGYHMQSYITDSISGQILDDYGMSYFVEDKFAEGLVSVQDAVINEIKERVPKDWLKSVTPVENEDVPVKETLPSESADNEEVSREAGMTIGDWLIGGCIVGGAIIVGFISGLIKKKIISAKDNITALQTEIQILRTNHVAELEALKKEHYEEITRLSNMCQRKENENNSLKEKLAEVDKKMSSLNLELSLERDRFSRVKRLHPEIDFDNEIQEMIAAEFKAEASKVDKTFEDVLSKKPDKSSIQFFGDALKTYDDVKAEVKPYLKTKCEDINKLYAESVALKTEYDRAQQEKRDKLAAQNAEDRVRIICSMPFASEKDYSRLRTAMGYYMSLTLKSKTYFSYELLQNLRRLLREAENDYRTNEKRRAEERRKREEEAERRREEERRRDEERRRAEAGRRASYSSSFRSHSSFSGHGGRPSGGGASRKF